MNTLSNLKEKSYTRMALLLAMLLLLLTLSGCPPSDPLPITPFVSITPSPASTPSPTSMPSPTSTLSTTGLTCPDGMVLISGGTGFCLSKTEVTNKEYRACVDSQGCESLKDPSSKTRPNYHNNPTYNDYPVVRVSWDDANLYCQAQGWRLPSAQDWRTLGVTILDENRPYPARAAGHDISQNGVIYWRGHVREWIADGPAEDLDQKYVRGASFFDSEELEEGLEEGERQPDIGFRCAAELFNNPSPTLTPTPEGSECPSEMVLIESGADVRLCFAKYEVTNQEYRDCVAAEDCNRNIEADQSSPQRDDYYNNPKYNDFPVVNVSWENALDYCESRGWALPTLEQWQAAVLSGFIPRGDTLPAYAGGADLTKDGIMNLQGNVQEWGFDGPPDEPDSIKHLFGDYFGHEKGAITTATPQPMLVRADDHELLGFRCVQPLN